MSNPRTEAMAYRIWGYAAPRGWDCETREVADALGVSPASVGAVARRKGWTNRFRSTEYDALNLVAQSGMLGDFDSVLQ